MASIIYQQLLAVLICPISHVVIMLYREPPANHQISQASQRLDEIGPSRCWGIDCGTWWLVHGICKELGEEYFSRAYPMNYRTLKYLAAKHCRLPRMQLVRKVPLIGPHRILVCLIWQQTAAQTSMTAVTFTMTFLQMMMIALVHRTPAVRFASYFVKSKVGYHTCS